MSGAGGGSTRFAPNTFQYNGRIAAALLPCLAVAALLGGQPVLAIFSVGAMLAYIMDALTYREGALAAAWATLGLSGIVLAIKVVASAVGRSPAVLATLLPASAALLTATGLWATLQFRWIQMRYPAVALASERLLLGGCLPLAAIFHSVGAALALDISSVPFVTAASCVLCYHWLARPLVSSFYQVKGFTSMGGSVPPHLLVLNKADGAILAFVTLCLPFILFIAIHSTSIGGWLNCWSVLLLVSAPASYLLVAPDGLWFVPGPPAVQKWLRRVALPPMLAMLVIALEGRVVFHAFSSYIKLSPPWSWLVVTGVLGCIAAGVAAAATGALETPAAATLLGVCFMVATAAGAQQRICWIMSILRVVFIALICPSRCCTLYFVGRQRCWTTPRAWRPLDFSSRSCLLCDHSSQAAWPPASLRSGCPRRWRPAPASCCTWTHPTQRSSFSSSAAH